MDTKINEIIKKFKIEIKKLYNDKLKDVILYGSYARGEATEDSDIDLAIVIDDNIQPGREIDKMIDIITDIGLEYDILISVYPFSEEEYRTVKAPILMNIRKEGILV